MMRALRVYPGLLVASVWEMSRCDRFQCLVKCDDEKRDAKDIRGVTRSVLDKLGPRPVVPGADELSKFAHCVISDPESTESMSVQFGGGFIVGWSAKKSFKLVAAATGAVLGLLTYQGLIQWDDEQVRRATENLDRSMGSDSLKAIQEESENLLSKLAVESPVVSSAPFLAGVAVGALRG